MIYHSLNYLTYAQAMLAREADDNVYDIAQYRGEKHDRFPKVDELADRLSEDAGAVSRQMWSA
jgi:hypothetical protein